MKLSRWISMAAFVTALSVMAGCTSKPLTEILLHIDSNLTPVTELTDVRVIARREGVSTPFLDQTFPLGTNSPMVQLPGTVALLPQNVDDPRPVLITVIANPNAANTFATSAQLSFVPGRLVDVDIYLARECLPAAVRSACELQGLTCGRGGQCVPVQITPVGMDGGMDTGRDVPTAEVVEAGSDVTDVAMDVTDVTDAGGCGTGGPCTNGTMCINSMCTCPAPNTMCGVDCVSTTSSTQHCGACNRPCPGGIPCTSGMCACPSGQTVCRTAGAARCADTMTDPTACGSTCVVCPFTGGNGAATCTNGTCGITCNAGYMLMAGRCLPRPGAVCPGTMLAAPPANSVTMFSGDTTMMASTRTTTCGGGSSPEIYYSFTVNGDTSVLLSILPTGWDAVVSIWDSCTGTQVACANASGVSGIEQVRATLQPNTTYVISVDGNGTMDRGSFSGFLSVSQPCGNRALDTGETCDDGNTINADGCSSTCQLEFAVQSICSFNEIEVGAGVQVYSLTFPGGATNMVTPPCNSFGLEPGDWSVILRRTSGSGPVTIELAADQPLSFLPTLMFGSGTICNTNNVSACSMMIVPPSPPNRVQIQPLIANVGRLFIDGIPSGGPSHATLTINGL